MAKKSPKLSFRQFLKSAGFESYAAYLESPHWHKTRERTLHTAKHRCHACNRQATEVHHVSYRRLGHERHRDLIAVCRTCHARIHEALDIKFPASRSVAYKAEQTFLVFPFLFDRPLWEECPQTPKRRQRDISVTVTVRVKRSKRKRRKEPPLEKIRHQQGIWADNLYRNKKARLQKEEQERLDRMDPFERSIAHLSFPDKVKARIERRAQEQRAGQSPIWTGETGQDAGNAASVLPT